MAVDLDILPALRDSDEWSIAAPANISGYLITIPYDPLEWATARSLLIEAVDGSGHFLGSSLNTAVAIDKATGLPRDFSLDVVLGIESENNFPDGFRRGRVVFVDGERFRKVLIDTPFTVRVTVDAPMTYGVQVTLDSR